MFAVVPDPVCYCGEQTMCARCVSCFMYFPGKHVLNLVLLSALAVCALADGQGTRSTNVGRLDREDTAVVLFTYLSRVTFVDMSLS